MTKPIPNLDRPSLDTSIELQFDAAATSYDREASVQDQVAQRLMQWFPPTTRGESILEIGCGTGLLTKRLLAACPSCQLTALDLSSVMVAQTRQRLAKQAERINWHVADLREFEPHAMYSRVVSSSVLHWVSPLEDAFTAIQRMLQPDGLVLIAVMLEGTLSELHECRRHVAPNQLPQQSLPTFNELIDLAHRHDWDIQISQSEVFQTSYRNAKEFLHALKRQGLTGGGVSRAKTPLNRSQLKAICDRYDRMYGNARGGVSASYHVGFLRVRHRTTHE